MINIYATTVQSLNRLILALSWATAFFCVLRFHRFDSHDAPLAAFLLLTLWNVGITVAVLFCRRFLLPNQNRSEPHIEKAIFLGPGLLLGLFLVLPSLHLFATMLYFFALGVLFSCFDRIKGSHGKSEGRMFRFSKKVDETNEIDGNVVEKLDGINKIDETIDEFNEIHENGENADSWDQWDEKTLLRLLRTRDEKEQEQLQAWMQAEFQKNQRIVNIHLPFFPVPDHVPHLEVLQFQGDEVDIKIAHITSMGVRIDLKRPARRKESESVGIFISATTQDA